MNNKSRVLIGSPIKQSPSILNRFLESLKALDKTSLEIDYYFIDDNENVESGKLLREFSNNIGGAVLIEESNFNDVYIKNETTHYWDNSLIWKVAAFKNKIIKYCIDQGYDYLFFIDSDLVLAPPTLEHLRATGKHIISEVYWTKWQPNTEAMPQVWLYDQYSYSEKNTVLDSAMKYLEFREKLRIPGIYRVGGLGACTLIHRDALAKGISFDPIYNLTFVGEDRHFCIRAAALGLELFVDTSYPAFHIYRNDYLAQVDDYIYTNRYCKTPPSQLLERDLFTIEFLNQFFTYDYSVKPYLSGVNLLSERYQTLMNKEKAELYKYLFENEIKCRLKNCKIVEMAEKADSHEIETSFLFTVEKSGTACEKEIFCRITLMKDYETIWKVQKITLIDLNKKELKGFHAMCIVESTML